MLTKSARNVTSPGSGQTNHGDVINWTVAYDGKGTGPAPATITDPITSGHTYVPGSLHAPPGWTPEWSTDGNTFQGTDPGTSTVAVRASNPTARGTGTNLANDLLAPVQASPQPTGGDGFSSILHRTPSGTVEAWNTYHHADFGAPKVVCSDLATAQPCPGGPWPKPLSSTAGPLSGTGDIATTLEPQYVLDPAQPDVVYYPAITTGQVGVGCLDMAARANCGFVPLEARGGSPSSVNSIGGLVQVGGNVYGYASTGQVLCMVLATHSPCVNQPYAAVVAPSNDFPGPSLSHIIGAMTVADGKVYMSSSPQAPTIGCFDPATASACAGWASPHPTDGAAYNAYTTYDTAGNANGVCVTVTANPGTVNCFALDGTAKPAPPGFPVPTAGVLIFNPETITAPNGHLASYFPAWGGALAGGAYCYDWTAAATCAGFPVPATHPTVNGGATRDYGYDYDTATQCLIGLGDAGVLFSMDPTTGASPCVHSGAAVTLTPGDFYCDGGTGHAQAYQKAQLTGINTANINLAVSSVSVTGPGDTPIATLPIQPDGSVDLSTISAAAHPSITASAHLILFNSNDFTPTNHPSMVVSYVGDPPQVCFRTTVSTTCTVTGVTNTATGTDSTAALTSNTVSLPVTPGAGCQPNVTVNKEICDGNDLHHCGPGKSGPWVKKSTPGLLGLLGTAYWRITVTNAGPVDAANVTLHDSQTQGCESAAGSFNLPANTSRQFYCSTFLLLLPFSNTAKASFVPTNSPPGTPRTYTSPSTAVACSLLCILN